MPSVDKITDTSGAGLERLSSSLLVKQLNRAVHRTSGQ